MWQANTLNYKNLNWIDLISCWNFLEKNSPSSVPDTPKEVAMIAASFSPSISTGLKNWQKTGKKQTLAEIILNSQETSLIVRFSKQSVNWNRIASLTIKCEYSGGELRFFQRRFQQAVYTDVTEKSFWLRYADNGFDFEFGKWWIKQADWTTQTQGGVNNWRYISTIICQDAHYTSGFVIDFLEILCNSNCFG